MSNQVQAQREYATQQGSRKLTEGLVQSIGEDIATGAALPASNIENLLSSCLSWTEDLEQEITKLISRLGPVLRPDRPCDPSIIACERKINASMSTVACRLETLSGRIMEQTRRLMTIKELIDL